ncbi:hypothetical protein [Streptomyces sp. NRRL S-146]|uniref:hypothetical protein n=1 Tax=Streptomyces sp. NRRL S-146 TaxID=1463884 RepID=UPI00068A0CE2|nr:hypothetical protein [Streptomyces sp. NRRL S-146]
MAHVESAHLVELALSNATPTDADAEALRHIETCTRCRDELRSLTHLVTAARTAQLVDLPTAPPDRVWQRISRDVSGGTAPPRPHARAPDHRKRALLALLALAAVGIAHRRLHERSKLAQPRVRGQDRPGGRT